MEQRTNYAIFVDLENCGGKPETLRDVIDKVKMRGDILLGKVYGYDESYSGLRELLLSNTFSVIPSIRWGMNQKNSLDIQLCIDALEVAYKNELIDCFCIVSGDSDYMPLVGKLKSMGKYVLGISRSEVASKVFINACNEFIFLESVSVPGAHHGDRQDNQGNSSDALSNLVERIVRDQAGADGFVYASEVKKTLSRLKPDFDERNFGFSSFGKLITMLGKRYKKIVVNDENHSLKISLATQEDAAAPMLNKSNWKEPFIAKLREFKTDGFDRVNPSIIKNAIQTDYPGFEERQIGFNRFSDVMRQLEKDGVVRVEMDETHSMLLTIL